MQVGVDQAADQLAGQAGGEPGGQRDPLARNGVPERALAGRECGGELAGGGLQCGEERSSRPVIRRRRSRSPSDLPGPASAQLEL